LYWRLAGGARADASFFSLNYLRLLGNSFADSSRRSFKPVAVLEHWELRFRYPLIANEALRAATGALDHSAPIFGLNVLYLRRRFGCFEVFWELKVGTAVPTRQCDR